MNKKYPKRGQPFSAAPGPSVLISAKRAESLVLPPRARPLPHEASQQALAGCLASGRGRPAQTTDPSTGHGRLAGGAAPARVRGIHGGNPLDGSGVFCLIGISLRQNTLKPCASGSPIQTLTGSNWLKLSRSLGKTPITNPYFVCMNVLCSLGTHEPTWIFSMSQDSPRVEMLTFSTWSFRKTQLPKTRIGHLTSWTPIHLSLRWYP